MVILYEASVHENFQFFLICTPLTWLKYINLMYDYFGVFFYWILIFNQNYWMVQINSLEWEGMRLAKWLVARSLLKKLQRTSRKKLMMNIEWTCKRSECGSFMPFYCDLTSSPSLCVACGCLSFVIMLSLYLLLA